MPLPAYETRDLLRFLTAGSVDDGKSTLIGRLLYDTKGIYQDQLASVRGGSRTGATHGIDFSLITDGLRSEREQGITIDVAYRCLSTARRRFIIADVPGHEQYTRNMATGASTSSLALLLMDARKGLLPQTHRHAAIAWLFGIRDFLVAVNKMDLVQFSEERFRELSKQFERFAENLGGVRAGFVPTCAPEGDNVVRKSARTPWFTGSSLIESLESAPAGAKSGSPGPLRFPVQLVQRGSDGARRYAGRIASGVVAPGDPVLVFPSARSTRVVSVRLGGQELGCAAQSQSVSISLADELDIGRGDMLASPSAPPAVSNRVTARLLWMNSDSLQVGQPYVLKHTTRQICCRAIRLRAVLDPATLLPRPAAKLGSNEFGEVEFEIHHALYCDSYSDNRVTGGFIIIDPITNNTLAAGMILSPCWDRETAAVRTGASGRGLTIWFTGLSSAGKSTLSQAVYEKLWARGHNVEWLDGDLIRRHLSKGLGFSKEDRDENIRRIGFVAELLTRNGVTVLVSAISPYRELRAEMRRRIGRFLEVYVNAPLAVCEHRDLKGIYRKARAGEIRGVTGVDDPYEPPLDPEVECRTDSETLADSTAKVLEAVDRVTGQPAGR